jgi:acyl-CoA synthetase (AMP-forming)/AMP-acid ligase II
MAIEISGLADIVRIHGARQPDTAAIVYEGRTTAYGALDRAASRVASALIAEGVRPQARVAHLDKSSDLFFELMFGVAKPNAAMVSVNWRLAPPEAAQSLLGKQAAPSQLMERRRPATPSRESPDLKLTP